MGRAENSRRRLGVWCEKVKAMECYELSQATMDGGEKSRPMQD
jgi:hypothetical protein